MLEGIFRPILQEKIIDKIGNIISKYSFITPNFITFLALITGILIFPAIVLELKVIPIILLFITGFFDVLDGTIARIKNKSSNFGAAFDIITDRIVEFFIVFSLFFIDPINRATPCIVMLGSIMLCVTSFLIVGIFSTNNSEKSFHYSKGLIERAEAFIFFALMFLSPNQFIFISYIFSSLVILTTVIRVKEFYNYEKNC